jgi:hypothetical protein
MINLSFVHINKRSNEEKNMEMRQKQAERQKKKVEL